MLVLCGDLTDVGRPREALLDGHFVIYLGKNAATAYLHTRARQIELLLQSNDQLIHEPARHIFALTRIGPAKI